jgi:hypothetical protein
VSQSASQPGKQDHLTGFQCTAKVVILGSDPNGDTTRAIQKAAAKKQLGSDPNITGQRPETIKNNSCQRIFHERYRPFSLEI